VTSGTLGNEQRNRLTGPGFQNVDPTVQRQIRFSPRVAATLVLLVLLFQVGHETRELVVTQVAGPDEPSRPLA
jgi:hypothetical protein